MRSSETPARRRKGLLGDSRPGGRFEWARGHIDEAGRTGTACLGGKKKCGIIIKGRRVSVADPRSTSLGGGGGGGGGWCVFFSGPVLESRICERVFNRNQRACRGPLLIPR